MKRNVKTALIIAGCAALVIAGIVLAICLKKGASSGPENPEETPSAGTSNGDGTYGEDYFAYSDSGFEFSGLLAYTGEYVEDGSNDPVSDIAAIRIRNKSGKDCRYGEVTVTTDKNSYAFTFTTLKNGESMTVLEKEKKTLNENSGILSARIEKTAPFNEEVSLYEDVFELTVLDGVINVKNKSTLDVDGTIYIYFKNTRETGLFGGITYRIRIDSLKAGELKQMSSPHLSKGNSVMEFITYER